MFSLVKNISYNKKLAQIRDENSFPPFPRFITVFKNIETVSKRKRLSPDMVDKRNGLNWCRKYWGLT